jgi:hypothetical protein
MVSPYCARDFRLGPQDHAAVHDRAATDTVNTTETWLLMVYLFQNRRRHREGHRKDLASAGYQSGRMITID